MTPTQPDPNGPVRQAQIMMDPVKESPSGLGRIALAVLLLGAFGAVVWLLGALPASGVDYYFTFYPFVQSWLAGTFRLYDPSTAGFYHPPWTLWLLALFGVMPYALGLAALRFVSLLALAVGIFTFSKPGRTRPWALALALANLYTFDLIQRGQIDAVSVAGTAAGWIALQRRQPWLLSLGYALLMFNPPNTVPVALLFLWLSWRWWVASPPIPLATSRQAKRWHEVLRSFTLPLGLVLASLVVFPGWMGRWVQFYAGNSPPRYWFTTLWRAQEALGLPRYALWLTDGLIAGMAVWGWLLIGRGQGRAREEKALGWLMLTIAATTLVSPYVTTYRLMLLVAVAMPCLIGWRPAVGAGLYLLTFSPLLRLWVGTENSWLDVTFMIAAFAAVMGYVVETFKPQLPAHEAAAR